MAELSTGLMGLDSAPARSAALGNFAWRVVSVLTGVLVVAAVLTGVVGVMTGMLSVVAATEGPACDANCVNLKRKLADDEKELIQAHQDLDRSHSDDMSALRQEEETLNVQHVSDHRDLETARAQLIQEEKELNDTTEELQLTKKSLRAELQIERAELKATTAALNASLVKSSAKGQEADRDRVASTGSHKESKVTTNQTPNVDSKRRTEEAQAGNDQMTIIELSALALLMCAAIAGLVLFGVARSKRSYAEQVQHNSNNVVPLNSEPNKVESTIKGAQTKPVPPTVGEYSAPQVFRTRFFKEDVA